MLSKFDKQRNNGVKMLPLMLAARLNLCVMQSFLSKVNISEFYSTVAQRHAVLNQI